MIVESLEKFPPSLRTRLKHVGGSAALAPRLSSVFEAVMADIDRLLSDHPRSSTPHRWEAGAIIGNELIAAFLSAAISPNLRDAKSVAATNAASIARVEELMEARFDKIARGNPAGTGLNVIVGRLRERYDPAILKSSGRRYAGIKAHHESAPPRFELHR